LAPRIFKNSPRLYNFLQIIVYVLWLALGIWMMVIGWNYMVNSRTVNTVLFGMSNKYLYAAVPVGYFMMNYRLIPKLIRAFKRFAATLSYREPLASDEEAGL
ncbi:MAG: TRAP transporter small permease subunit, partial [Negativicutes bacterium]